MKEKTPSDSKVIVTEIVLPNDTNTLGNLMGGRLLHLMDVAAAVAAGRHSNRVVVTASVDYVDFKSEIKLGEVINMVAKVTRAFNTSMEIIIEVWAENTWTNAKRKCNNAFFTFVAVDQSGRPIPVNPLVPETEEEKELYESAQKRRDHRLALAGRK